MNISRVIYTAMFALPAAAQTCTGATDFSGHYIFVATRQLVSPPPPAPERITNIPPQYSPTPVGSSLRGALGTAPFAAIGRLVADGQGGLFAGSSEAVYITTRVGSYSVTTECTLNMTVVDGFTPNDPVAPAGTVSFTGILQSRGGESNLIQTTGGSGTTLSLSRAQVANSCSNATFSGPYGLAGTGLQWTIGEEDEDDEVKPEALRTFTMTGRIISDGSGNLFLQDGTQGTPLQFTGTYSLQPDCTGLAKITDGRSTYTIEFGLSQANPAQNFTAAGVAFSRPVMRFVIADPKMAVTGVGKEATGRL
jgi:hypothetical protein